MASCPPRSPITTAPTSPTMHPGTSSKGVDCNCTDSLVSLFSGRASHNGPNDADGQPIPLSKQSASLEADDIFELKSKVARLNEKVVEQDRKMAEVLERLNDLMRRNNEMEQGESSAQEVDLESSEPQMNRFVAL